MPLTGLKKEGKLRKDVVHYQVKYLNNDIESDYVPIKKLFEAGNGPQRRAWSTIQDYESLRMLNKGQFDFWLRREDPNTRLRKRSAFIGDYLT
ncbi:mobile element protein [Vibrio astriarenae]|nr:mobile element protein [Vibrio sp. C7]